MNIVLNNSDSNSNLEFLLYTDITEIDTSRLTITVDECTNYENMFSEEDSNHDYVFTNNDSTITIEKDCRSTETVIVYRVVLQHEDLKYFDHNLKFVRIVFYKTGLDQKNIGEGLYYSSTELYHGELNLLRTFCNTCLDDKQMQMIMLITFKRLLFEQALNGDHYQEAMSLYLDMCRVLGISVVTSSRNRNSSIINCNKCNSCSSCVLLEKPTQKYCTTNYCRI